MGRGTVGQKKVKHLFYNVLSAGQKNKIAGQKSVFILTYFTKRQL